MKAWHFVHDWKLRDGSTLPKIGQVLKHDGNLELCRSGLHASKRIIDALWYAPGSIVCRVECGGKIIRVKDKLVCSERTILWCYNAVEILAHFVRWCISIGAPLYNASGETIQYCRGDDEYIRSSTWLSARSLSREEMGNTVWHAIRSKQNRCLTRVITKGESGKQILYPDSQGL